ncbi:MAG: carbon-nitrogen hydrolase family protein [Alphaproteobacteria bacterium]|nr:carbon-nitrogen hydrolase family protein [Alphaproteobacteria bacterium]
MSSPLTVACVQMTSGPDIEENLTQAGKLIREAAVEGAEFIATPENTDFIRKETGDALATALEPGKHPGPIFFAELAKQLGVWLLIGSMKIKVSETKMANRSFLFSKTGQLMASYDKMHLFNCELPTGESHKESETVEAGNKAAVVKTPWKPVGLSICYDVRFPYMYRAMAQRGAEIIAVPSAFTVPTGKAHWETLLRARAIETGSFVIAPAQVGTHEGGRETYGHSMIVNPWGKVIAERTEDTPGFILRKLHFEDVTKARFAVPSLQHDCEFDFYETKL